MWDAKQNAKGLPQITQINADVGCKAERKRLLQINADVGCKAERKRLPADYADENAKNICENQRDLRANYSQTNSAN